MTSFLPQGEGWLPSWLLLVSFSQSLPSKVHRLTHSGLRCVYRQHYTSLLDHKEHAPSLSSIRLRHQRPLLKDFRYLDHRVCRHPFLHCLQHIQSPGLPARNLGLRHRIGSFHERVACVQDGGVGQGSGRAHIHFHRKFGLDVQPVGLLCPGLMIQLFKPIPVQFSATTAKPCRSLLRCNISLRFGHQLVSTPVC